MRRLFISYIATDNATGRVTHGSTYTDCIHLTKEVIEDVELRMYNKESGVSHIGRPISDISITITFIQKLDD